MVTCSLDTESHTTVNMNFVYLTNRSLFPNMVTYSVCVCMFMCLFCVCVGRELCEQLLSDHLFPASRMILDSEQPQRQPGIINTNPTYVHMYIHVQYYMYVHCNKNHQLLGGTMTKYTLGGC